MGHRLDSRGNPIYSTNYYDIPVQTEKNRQYLSGFQSKNLLNDQIDYLLQQENWIPTDWEKTTEYGSPKYNYGQKISDPDAWSGHRANPQAHQNIWRMHGEGNYKDLGLGKYARENDIFIDWDELNRLYGEERYEPDVYGETAPNWDYIDALELFRDSYDQPPMSIAQRVFDMKKYTEGMTPEERDEYIDHEIDWILDTQYSNRLGIMNTADAYKDIDRGTAEANVGGVDVGKELTGTAGFYSSPNIILNPANVVKKYPTAPMGPDSEWEFLGPDEQNMKKYREDDNWNMYRILPHETGHHKARRDWFYGRDDPNPGAYLEGIWKKDYYSDFDRHPMMHTTDRLLHDKSRRHSLSKTQYQNFLHHQKTGMQDSLNRGYDHTEDRRNSESLGGHFGSGRSRIENTGRPMYQSQASRAVMPSPSTPPDRNPRRHHFDTGGIAGLPGGQWSPSTIPGDEEIYDIKPLQMDPGIMSIDDLEDLFEEAGLDKRIIYDLINTGGLSQLVS